ncbi:nuclear transport factor 2 family protein [Dactylosporangium sp. NBC_01737]|uniref:YybH family protein n=1 Tax=Dactylosporangium sp. NBC_01737 TaxID=2975959 RepID=UPI002E13C539|nr:nuclear transport factor 2 family protein [Dactylosporangium sp. NBC_01737]
MTVTDHSDEELAALVRRTAEAASAFIRGDIRTYIALLPHAGDYTLLPPYGDVRHGFDHSDASLDATARWFQGGEAELEVVRADRSGDLAVIVAIERQHGVVGGLPEQDWSLRVTLVFRRQDGEWTLLHRHADPLVHTINHQQVSALARD